jgi:hypothetical protein
MYNMGCCIESREYQRCGMEITYIYCFAMLFVNEIKSISSSEQRIRCNSWDSRGVSRGYGIGMTEKKENS